MAVLERHYQIDILKSSFSVEELRGTEVELLHVGEDGDVKPDAESKLGPAFAELLHTLGKTDVSSYEYVHERQYGDSEGRDNCRKRRMEPVVGGEVKWQR
jgi:hypothetical protein